MYVPAFAPRSAIVAICTRWQRAREPTTWQATVVVVTNAAAQLPQRRGAVGRRRAGRPRWTARRAPSCVPRGLRADPPAAAVRGAASAPLLAHAHLPHASAAAHRRRPSLRRWLVCARLATAERSRARSRGASARQCTKLCRRLGRRACVELRVRRSDSVTPSLSTQMALHSSSNIHWSIILRPDAIVVCILWG